MKTDQVVIGWVRKRIVVVLAGDDLRDIVWEYDSWNSGDDVQLTHVAVGRWVYGMGDGTTWQQMTHQPRMTVHQARKKLYGGGK
jgi:hypothetical protein